MAALSPGPFLCYMPKYDGIKKIIIGIDPGMGCCYCLVHEASYVIPENAPGSEFVLGFLSSVCFTSAYSTLSSHDGDGTRNCIVFS